jgi:hypothetical protein
VSKPTRSGRVNDAKKLPVPAKVMTMAQPKGAEAQTQNGNNQIKNSA